MVLILLHFSLILKAGIINTTFSIEYRIEIDWTKFLLFELVAPLQLIIDICLIVYVLHAPHVRIVELVTGLLLT